MDQILLLGMGFLAGILAFYCVFPWVHVSGKPAIDVALGSILSIVAVALLIGGGGAPNNLQNMKVWGAAVLFFGVCICVKVWLGTRSSARPMMRAAR